MTENKPSYYETLLVFSDSINQRGYRNWFASDTRISAFKNVRDWYVQCESYFLDRFKHDKKVADLETQIKILKEQKSYEREYKDYQKENKVLVENLERSGGEKIELARKAESAKLECSDALRDLVNARAEISGLRLQITKIEKEKAEIKKELKDVRKLNDSLMYSRNELAETEEALKDIEDIVRGVFARRGSDNNNEVPF